MKNTVSTIPEKVIAIDINTRKVRVQWGSSQFTRTATEAEMQKGRDIWLDNMSK